MSPNIEMLQTVASGMGDLLEKVEAHKSRGGNDLRQSRDFEDIVYLMEHYPELKDNIIGADKNVKTYLKVESKVLLENPYLNEGIDCALSSGSLIENDQIIEIFKIIAELKVQ